MDTVQSLRGTHGWLQVQTHTSTRTCWWDLIKSRYVREVNSVTWVGGGGEGELSKPGTPHMAPRNNTILRVNEDIVWVNT